MMKMMDFVPEMMNFILKMMEFILKMMNIAGAAAGWVCREGG